MQTKNTIFQNLKHQKIGKIFCMLLVSLWVSSVSGQSIVIPSITSFTPMNGAPGTSVTITGVNFNSTLAQNSVFLNGAKCTVTAATTTSLTVTIPTQVSFGAFYYSNLGTGMGCFSPLKFLVRSANPDPGNPLFNRFPTNVSTASAGTIATAAYYGLADVNTDGKLDVFQYNGQGSPRGNAILNNSTTSSLSFSRTQIAPPVVSNQWDINMTYTGDFNNDGNMDFYSGVGGYQPGTVNINTTANGSSTITLGNFIQTGTNSMTQSDKYYYHVADVDWDGDLDMLSIGSSNFQHSKNNHILNGVKQASVSFQGKFTTNYSGLAGTAAPKFGLSADLNRDRKPDFITFSGGNTFDIIRNTSNQNADGQFWTFAKDQQFFLVGSTSINAELVDLDGDGDLDLVVANGLSGANAISIYYNQTPVTSGATIAFGSRQDINIPNAVTSVSIYDFNGDGKPDILANSSSSAGYYYIRNTSTTTTTATFAPAVSAGGNDGNAYRRFDIADLNSDGFPDIATSSSSGVSFFQYASNIRLTGSISDFNSCVGTASTAQSLVVACSGLSSNLTITAPSSMEVSLSASSGYASTLTLNQSGGNIANTTIFIRVTSAATIHAGDLSSISFVSGTNSKSVTTFRITRDIPTVSSTSGATRCGIGSVNLSANVSAGAVEWYSASSGGVIQGTGSTFTTPSLNSTTTYFVQANNSGCISTSRSSVLATINVATITGPSSIILGSPVTLVGSGTPNPTNPWVSSNTSIATINSSGVLTPVAVGTATINYTSTTGCGSLNISVDASTYYARSSGATMLFNLNNWSSNFNGTGAIPTGFRPGVTFILDNSVGTTSFNLGNGINMEGNLVIPTGKTLTFPNFSSVNFSGNITNNGTITGLNGSNFNIQGSGTKSVLGNGSISVPNFSNAATVTSFENNLTVTNQFTHSGTMNLMAGRVIQITGTGGCTFGGAISGSGIVRMNGTSAQTISSSAGKVANLEILNNTTLNFGNALVVDSSFLVASGKIFYISPFAVSTTTSLTVNGNYSNLGNIIGYGQNSSPFPGAVLIYNGSSQIELGLVSPFNLTIGNNCGKVTSNSNSTISGSLTVGQNSNFEVGVGKLLPVMGNISNNGRISGLGSIQLINSGAQQGITGGNNSSISRMVVNAGCIFSGTNTIEDSLLVNASRTVTLATNSTTYLKNHVQIGGNFSSQSGSTVFFQNRTMANFGNSSASTFWNLVVDSSSAGIIMQNTVPACAIFNSITNNSTITSNNGFNCGQVGSSVTIRGNGNYPKILCIQSVGTLVNIFDSPTFTGDFSAGLRKVILNGGRLTVLGATSLLDANSTVVTGNQGVFTQRVGNASAFTAHIAHTSTSGDYYPVIVTNNTGSADEYSFTIRNNAFQNGRSGSNGNGVIPRTWVVTKKTANGGTGVNLSFTHLSSDSLVSGFTRKVLFRFDGSNWVQVPGSFVNNAINNRTITINNYMGELNNTMFAIGDSATAFVRTKFYPIAGQSGNIHLLSSWRSNANGTGNAPVTFGENCEFVLSDASNTNAFTLNGNWDLRGKLTVPVGRTLNLGNNATLNLAGDLINLGDVNSANNSKLVLNGAANQTIEGNIQLRNLEVTSGNTVRLRGNVQVADQILLSNSSALNLESTLNIQANVQGSTGTELRFSGTSAQSMSGSVNVGKITVNNPQSITMSGSVQTNSTNFVQGKINLGTQNFYSASFDGASANSYIAIRGNGKVNTTISNGTSTLIPVGGDHFSPVTITNNNATPDTFGIGFMDSVTKYGNSGNGINSQRNRVNQTWMINKSGPNVGGVSMTFNWNSSKVVGGLSNPTLFRYADTAWNLNQSGTSTSSGQSLTVSNYMDNLSTPFVIVDGATPLPVTWVGINAKWKMENHAILTWTTSMESNVNYFAIEKMNASKQFEVIGTTKAAGNSVQMQTYQFEDDQAILNSQVYRVTSVDFDGTRNSSAMVVLSQTNKNQMAVFPNPCTETIMIQTEKGNSIEIFNLNGKLVHATKANQLSEEIDLSMLSSGIYFLKSSNGITSNTIKLVKK